MTENGGKQEQRKAVSSAGSSDIRDSWPESPLIVPEAMSFPVGTHYIQVPDPRGSDASSFRYYTSNPEIGRSVVVEMKVSRGEAPFPLRWAFRYVWAKWSLILNLGKEERWELVVEEFGPRTEMQVHALYELAAKLHFNCAVEPFKRKWPEVKSEVLPKNWRRTSYGPSAATQKRIEELAERAIVDLKLLAAKSKRAWRKRADPETTILQTFLQRRTSARLLCEIFDLEWKSCVPMLQGLQDAYDRLISEALARRCSSVLKARRAKKITLQEAADILFLESPVAEDILRIGAVVERKFIPADKPTKKELLEAIDVIEALKLAFRPGTRTAQNEP